MFWSIYYSLFVQVYIHRESVIIENEINIWRSRIDDKNVQWVNNLKDEKVC